VAPKQYVPAASGLLEVFTAGEVAVDVPAVVVALSVPVPRDWMVESVLGQLVKPVSGPHR
jgi:hypothetical protein